VRTIAATTHYTQQDVFGFSIGDIASLIQLTTTAYRGWKNACGEFAEITGELNSFLVVVRGVEAAARAPDSLLSRKDADCRGFKQILNDRRRVVSQHRDVVTKFRVLGWSKSRNWERLRLGTKDLSILRG
jgi:hypothetical protein